MSERNESEHTGKRDAHEDLASNYLADNEALRAAVNASDGEMLVPRFLGMGEHNLNYSFEVPSSGDSYVLRINVVSQPFHDDQVSYEFEGLSQLQACGRVPKAVYLDNSSDAPGKGAMVIGLCEGEQLDFDHLRPGDLRCVAQIMADVHAVKPSPDCCLFQPKDPLKTLFDECVRRYELYRSSAFEDARVSKWVESFISAAETATRTSCSAEDCAHIVNTEPLPSHFLIPKRASDEAATADGTGRFCEEPGYFVDWERPVIGEVAQDIAYFVSPTTTFWDSEYLFPFDEAQAFVEEYWQAVDGRFARGSFDKRFKAFRMMTALRSATWCCRALVRNGSRNQKYSSGKSRAKLPTYLSDDFMHMLARDCFELI